MKKGKVKKSNKTKIIVITIIILAIILGGIYLYNFFFGEITGDAVSTPPQKPGIMLGGDGSTCTDSDFEYGMLKEPFFVGEVYVVSFPNWDLQFKGFPASMWNTKKTYKYTDSCKDSKTLYEYHCILKKRVYFMDSSGMSWPRTTTMATAERLTLPMKPGTKRCYGGRFYN
jgi:hypothetical protein